MRIARLSIREPGPGRLVVRHADWFVQPELTGKFLQRALTSPAVRWIAVDRERFEAEVAYVPGRRGEVAAVFRAPPARLPDLLPGLLDTPFIEGQRRWFCRFGDLISDWTLQEARPGLLRLRHVRLRAHPRLQRALARALDHLNGVLAFRVDGLGGGLTVRFDPACIGPEHLIRVLHDAMTETRAAAQRLIHRLDTPVATTSLGLSAVATFFAPALLPVSTALMLGTAAPSYRRAVRVVAHKRRLGVDVLDSIIFTACLFTGQIFAGAMTAFFLSVGRTLLRRTRAQSLELLTDAFAKQAKVVRRERGDGSVVETSIEQVRAGDIIVVHTGEAVPVDGVVQSGEGMLDQQALTGESAPVDRAEGDPVLAATLLVAGQIRVRVERAGKETTAGQITQILRQTVAHKLELQSRCEALADTIVIPTLGVSGVAGGLIGTSGALAVINSDLGTGIRMAAPLAVVTSLSACIHAGILVKQGRALELLPTVDTVVFDKTGTLTRSVPEVGQILTCGRQTPSHLLRLAAAAEQNFSHPIARAIVDHYQATGGPPLPSLDASQYALGFGLTVTIEGSRVRLGSARFMAREGIAFPPALERAAERLREQGHTLVYLTLDDHAAGIIDLRPSQRPEALDTIEGLRTRGVRQLVILSGDHDRPTRELSRTLGVDRYFAEVLPQDKASVIAELQREGRSVCFVGDGINDALALRQADVSVSLHGASGIAVDTAQVVFLEGNLRRMCELFDIARDLHRNVSQSWGVIRAANGICVAGVFLAGFDIWHSVFFNNVSALGALGNSLRPLARSSGTKSVLRLLA
ncbi:MAG: heavy metal translocating P-type ATPase, partial [Acetobacteraceae bacterium]|nr:heavy metal translocating P-type ATPase [Acetobacteraceae bacterium]